MDRIVRPDWDTFTQQYAGVLIACTCGQILHTFEQVRAHWESGHFDYVVKDSEATVIRDLTTELAECRERLANERLIMLGRLTCWLSQISSRKELFCFGVHDVSDDSIRRLTLNELAQLTQWAIDTVLPDIEKESDG